MTSSDTPTDLKSKLFSMKKKDYGEKYSDHLLEQYKLFVEMMDEICARRATTNTFYLTLNTLLMTAIGILTKLGADLTGYLAGYLYGFIYTLFPAVFLIFLSNRLVTKHVDNGSMVYLLNTPNSRKKIIITQALSTIIFLVSIYIVNVLVGIVLSQIMFDDLLNINDYLLLNLVTVSTLICISSINFLFSCI